MVQNDTLGIILTVFLLILTSIAVRNVIIVPPSNSIEPKVLNDLHTKISTVIETGTNLIYTIIKYLSIVPSYILFTEILLYMAIFVTILLILHEHMLTKINYYEDMKWYLFELKNEQKLLK